MSENTELELFRTVVEYGRDTIKASMIINGAASIAVLTFIGNIWSTEYTQETGNFLALGLLLFCIGALLSTIAFGWSFFLRFIYNFGYSLKKSQARGKELGRQYNFLKKIGIKLYNNILILKIILVSIVIFSYIVFVLGAFYSYRAVISHMPLS